MSLEIKGRIIAVLEEKTGEGKNGSGNFEKQRT